MGNLRQKYTDEEWEELVKNTKNTITDKEVIEKLKHVFEETIWMAIRYADGRQTYAPNMVRAAVKQFQTIFPDWKPKADGVIKPPNKEDSGFESDYLHDIF